MNGRELVDKTIANMDVVAHAQTELRKSTGVRGYPRTESEKQALHVEGSMDRCRRCGDYNPLIIAGLPLATICAPCEAQLKLNEPDAGVMWFADMVAIVNKPKE